MIFFVVKILESDSKFNKLDGLDKLRNRDRKGYRMGQHLCLIFISILTLF